MAQYKIATIPGDGIGQEIVPEAIKVLEKIGKLYQHEFVFTEVLAGGIAIDKTGEPLPAETVKICKAADAVLLGAVGGWQWDNLPGDKRPERALLGLRGELGLYANLRPAYLYEEMKDACPLRPELVEDGIDIMVVRELTGGMYFGDRGRKETPLGLGAWDTELYATEEVRRIAVTAFELARKRRSHVTNVDKANVLESSRLWREVVLEVAKSYPDVKLDHLYIDNATMQVIRVPSSFDVVVTTNMFGDILSDETSQLTGSIGLLPSASLGSGSMGMYEPIHGSAPDIAGQDKANPIAMILSAAMMLRYSLGLSQEATIVEDAVKSVLATNARTADIMSTGKDLVGTREMGRMILSEIDG